MKRTIYKKAIYLIAGVLLLNNTIKAQEASKNDFKPSGNLWGYVFGDYFYKTKSDTLGRGGKNVQYTPGQSNIPNVKSSYNSFQIRRAYLGYDYNFARNFTAYVVLANEQNVDASGYNTTYLKYAYVKWSNIFKNSDLIIGQQTTPSFATAFGTEPLWGYRSSERTIMDMHNNDASSDLGVSLQGKAWMQKIADSLKPSLIGYQIQVGNGNSAKPATTRFKKFRGTIFVSTLKQKLTLGVYGDYNNSFPTWTTATVTGTGPSQDIITFKGYAHFKTEWFRIGAEVFNQSYSKSDIYKTSSTAKADTTSGSQFGWSVFLTGQIIKHKLNYFVRMDKFNPDTKFNKNDIFTYTTTGKVSSTNNGAINGGDAYAATFYTQTFYNIGLDFTPIPRVHIMPNLWLNQYNSMASTDVVTGKAITGRQKTDSDVVYRITFYYVFNGSKKISNNGMEN